MSRQELGKSERMAQELTYRDYVHNDAHMEQYRRYQSRYSEQLRETDRVLIDLVRAHVGDAPRTLVDVGCSTGNLLLHLHRLLPDLKLVGADLNASAIAHNRKNPALAGIGFLEMDMLEFPKDRTFDVVVANAALMLFEPEDFRTAMLNLASAVNPGGLLAVFDYFHPHEQELVIHEVTPATPKGLKLFMRSYASVKAALEPTGLTSPTFHPFHMPFDLPQTDDRATFASHTVKGSDGVRMSFRGALFQPWCHLTATRV
jgi:SAM-dependent methyltransferase